MELKIKNLSLLIYRNKRAIINWLKYLLKLKIRISTAILIVIEKHLVERDLVLKR